MITSRLCWGNEMMQIAHQTIIWICSRDCDLWTEKISFNCHRLFHDCGGHQIIININLLSKFRDLKKQKEKKCLISTRRIFRYPTSLLLLGIRNQFRGTNTEIWVSIYRCLPVLNYETHRQFLCNSKLKHQFHKNEINIYMLLPVKPYVSITFVKKPMETFCLEIVLMNNLLR